MQEAQRQYALADPESAVVALVDLLRSDFIHLDTDGYKEAGRRLAFAVLNASYGQTLPLGPRLQTVISDGANEIVISYDVPVVGGAPGLCRVTDSSGRRQSLPWLRAETA